MCWRHYVLLGWLVLLSSCALSETADEARIAGRVGTGGLLGEAIGVEAGFEVALRRNNHVTDAVVGSVDAGPDRGFL